MINGKTTPAEIWGRLYAIYNYIIPEGLNPVQKDAAATEPGKMLRTAIQLVPSFPSWAERKIAEYIGLLTVADMHHTLTEDDQRNWLYGYQAEQKILYDYEPTRIIKQKQPGISVCDWSKVDLTRNSTELAKELGCSKSAIYQQRQRKRERQRKS